MDDVVIGSSRRMQSVFDFLRVIADGMGTVLITGESGSGKEVIAHLVHEQSRRHAHPFIPVSCAIFTETLIESELFGHERGAFTDAIRERPGRFELARGGTVFLDDIDDVPLSIQVKLLRVLQTHTVERIGSIRAIPVDVRIIAGTKRDLKHLVDEGRFRDDLYYRLNVLPITLPPLRERREDIPALMDHFLARFFGARAQPVPSMSPEIREAFVSYSWPGNVRELENACERIAQTCTCGRVRAGCVPARMLLDSRGPAADGAVREAPRAAETPDRHAPLSLSLEDRLREVECSLISWALHASGGNKTKAANLLMVKRSTLSGRLQKCGYSPVSSRRDADEPDLPISA
jgi:DNA-binding NtrC family response regulator